MLFMDYKPGRFYVVIIFFIVLYFALACNLYFLQVKQSSFFKDLGFRQYHVTVENFPDRGLIYDASGKLVALNKDFFSIFILPKVLNNKEQCLNFLKQHFPQAYDRFHGNESKNFMFVKRNVSKDELDLIEQSGVVDFHLLKESGRFYPYPSLGEVVGITDIDNQGLFGIESLMNKQLQGSATVYQLKKDAKSHHFYFEKETKTHGVHAVDVHLTIDADLQSKCQDILHQVALRYQSKEAGAIIMDPETGAIITAISYPSFDPNKTKELDLETTKCRPITNCFESGSVLKIFGALAALQEGVVSLDEEIDCLNAKETKLDNLRIRTVYPDGIISFLRVMQRSNNIGIVKVVKRLGVDLYDYYKMVGFGEYTGVNFPGEQKGFVNHPDNWSAFSIQSLAYGYEITNTLLQLARALSTIFNGGNLVTPRLQKDQPIQSFGPIISEKTITDLRTILKAVVEDGSAHYAHIDGYDVYGKTGTAHILIKGQYDESRHFYSFAGAVVRNNYKRVICCYVKDSVKATYASQVTAPLFKKLAEAMILRENVGL